MPSSPQTVTTYTVFDYEYDATGKAYANAPVSVRLDYSEATSISPVTNLESSDIATTTDANGYWSVSLVANNNISPANTVYTVRIPNGRSYQISVSNVSVPAGGWQSSAIAVTAPTPPSSSTPTVTTLTVTGNATVGGTFIVTGAATFNGTITGPDAGTWASTGLVLPDRLRSKYATLGEDGSGNPIVTDNTNVFKIKANPTYVTTGPGNGIFWVSEDLGGTTTDTQIFFNQLVSNTDTVNTTAAAGATFFRVNDNITAGSHNGRTGLLGGISQAGATTQAVGSYYVGLAGTATANSSAGGSAGGGNTRGNLFAFNAQTSLKTGAGLYWNSVVGAEIDWEVQTGTATPYKVGLQMVTTAADAVAGSILDAGITFSKQNTMAIPGWAIGISFGQQQGWWPAASTATLIGTQSALAGGPSYNAGFGIDFSAVTFANAFLKGPGGFTVDGASNVTINGGPGSGTYYFTATSANGAADSAGFSFNKPGVAHLYWRTVPGVNNGNVELTDGSTQFFMVTTPGGVATLPHGPNFNFAATAAGTGGAPTLPANTPTGAAGGAGKWVAVQLQGVTAYMLVWQ